MGAMTHKHHETAGGESQQPAESVRFLSVTEDQAGQRLDNFLLTAIKGVPRSWIYRVIRTGQVRVNRGRVRVSTRIQSGDMVRIPPVRLPEKDAPVMPGKQRLLQLEQAIVFENDSLLVLNKPAGWAVHGGSGLRFGIVEVLRHLRPDAACLELVHRLDRDTSGCLLIAKKRSMLRYLHDCIREQRMTKIYCALVDGHWPSRRTRVCAPLQKNVLQSGERMVHVSKEGKASVTHFRVLETYAHATLVEARLETGRTHQIRVHSLSAGHPVLGDTKYGTDPSRITERKLGLGRLFLHATELGFHLPDGQWQTFFAPLPGDLSTILERLGGGQTPVAMPPSRLVPPGQEPCHPGREGKSHVN